DDDEDRDDGLEVDEVHGWAPPLAAPCSCAAAAGVAAGAAAARLWPAAIRSTTARTAGSAGARNRVGNTPITMAIATAGPSVAHSRGDRSGSAAFFGLVTSP